MRFLGKALFIVGIVVTTLSSTAQMLDNRQGTAFTDEPFFNENFIQQNGIKQIKGQFTYKKSGEIMKNTDYNYVYEFDRSGHLITTFETKKDDGTADTTWNKYVYADNNVLIKHKRGDGHGFTTTEYIYDQNNQIIEEIFFREFTDSLGESKKIILNKEKIEYQKNDQQLKRTIKNSYDLPYMNEFFYYNENGYLTEKVQRLIMTLSVVTKKYEYNDKGWISAIRTYHYGKDVPVEELHFVYDNHGNLMEKQIYRNGEWITEIQMIYNEKSKLLSYVLTRDVGTNFIMILGFKDYSFFSDSSENE